MSVVSEVEIKVLIPISTYCAVCWGAQQSCKVSDGLDKCCIGEQAFVEVASEGC